MDDFLRNLNDHDAERVLSIVAQSRVKAMGGVRVPWTAAVRDSITRVFPLIKPAAVAVTPPDLARTALSLIGANGANHRAIETVADDLPERGMLTESALSPKEVAEAALVILESFVGFERDKSGHWTARVGKSYEDDSPVVHLVRALLSYPV